jgi:hypothetical protein
MLNFDCCYSVTQAQLFMDWMSRKLNVSGWKGLQLNYSGWNPKAALMELICRGIGVEGAWYSWPGTKTLSGNGISQLWKIAPGQDWGWNLLICYPKYLFVYYIKRECYRMWRFRVLIVCIDDQEQNSISLRLKPIVKNVTRPGLGMQLLICYRKLLFMYDIKREC